MYLHYVAIQLYIQLDVRIQYNRNTNLCLRELLLGLREFPGARGFQEHIEYLIATRPRGPLMVQDDYALGTKDICQHLLCLMLLIVCLLSDFHHSMSLGGN